MKSKIRVLAPNFIQHSLSPGGAAGDSDRKQRAPIFSLDIHPDGSRLATGGNDHLVRLWSIASIVDDSIYRDTSTPRELYAGKRHDGAIMCLRWCNKSGKLLASAADDGTMVIWQMDRTPSHFNPLLSGGASSIPYTENMRVVKRLPSMESDVIDLAWSPDNRCLASCSLDNSIVIWSGVNFERVVSFNHDSFVKGLAFDPTGTYLISQSDDGSAIVWSTKTWTAVRRIKSLFVEGPSVTLFKRPSWSPDGNYVACANAINNGCHVSAMMKRGVWDCAGWQKMFSLVGHTAPICVARFSPKLYQTDAGKVRSIIAIGSSDRRVSVWINGKKPVLVLEDVFVSDITDLAWSADGSILLASAREGRVAGFYFPDQYALFGGRTLTESEVNDRLSKHGFNAHEFHVLDFDDLVAQPPVFANTGQGVLSDTSVNASCQFISAQQIVTTVNGKKRIRPILVSSINPDLMVPLSAIESSTSTNITTTSSISTNICTGRILTFKKRNSIKQVVIKHIKSERSDHIRMQFTNNFKPGLSRLSINIYNGPVFLDTISNGNFTHVRMESSFHAAATDEPALYFYSYSGRCIDDRLVILCTDGLLQLFDMAKQVAIMSPVSIQDVLTCFPKSVTVRDCSFRLWKNPSPHPMIFLSNSQTYAFNTQLLSFVRVRIDYQISHIPKLDDVELEAALTIQAHEYRIATVLSSRNWKLLAETIGPCVKLYKASGTLGTQRLAELEADLQRVAQEHNISDNIQEMLQ